LENAELSGVDEFLEGSGDVAEIAFARQ
jgi:hypothetical protein